MNTWLVLTGSILLTLVVGAIGGISTADAVPTWFTTLNKPSFNPPSWLFGPVWTTLYIMMAVAAWRVWLVEGFKRNWLAPYVVQLLLNLAWSLIFFGARRPDFALIEIVLLWISIVVTLVVFRRIDRVAGWLLAPYLAWVSFATILNGAIWWLNR